MTEEIKGFFKSSGKYMSPILCTKCHGSTFKLFATEFNGDEIVDFIFKCNRCSQVVFEDSKK